MYFNHAYKKVFVATAVGVAKTRGGIVNVAGEFIGSLKTDFGPGVAGLFDKVTNKSIIEITRPFYIAASAVKIEDKQGPFHGGYQESSKSKMINPKYVRDVYKVSHNEANRSVLHIGATAFNLDQNAECAKEFLCGEDYNIRVDVKGMDALRFVNHNAYIIAEANGGCCDDPSVPTPVDAAVIMKQFALYIANDPIFSQFLRPIVDIDGVYYAATAEDAIEEGLDPAVNLIELAPDTSANGTSAGLILIGALVETQFKNCTFQVKDYYQVEPLQIFASEVDFNGDPCLFEGLCVIDQCKGIQANGLGEQKLRELILSESYLQNFFHSDLRIREITQGDQMFDVIDRKAFYDSLFVLHSVPRFNNPTGVFDNDQYLLEIVTDADGLAYVAGIFKAAIDANVIDVELDPVTTDIKDYTLTQTCDDTLPTV